MAKTKISQYDAVAANNTDVANINIAEGCSPSNINNSIRAVMSHLKDFQAGNQTGNALAVASGGTWAENAADARTNLGLGSVATLNSITSAYITDGTIATADIADGAVTDAKIDTMTSSKLTGALPAIDGSALTGITTYTDSDALSLFNASGSAPVYACRAWVNFDGTGSVGIRDSGNVSSITDNGTGEYTVNFTTAMQDNDYAVCATYSSTSISTDTGGAVAQASTMTTSAVGLRGYNNNNDAADADVVSVAIFR